MGTEVWIPFWRDQLQPYQNALVRLTPDALGDADLGSCAERLRPQGPNFMSPEASRRRAREMLSMWLCGKLADRSFSCVCSPGSPVQFLRGDHGGEPFDVLLKLEKGELSSRAWADRWRELSEAG